MGGSEGTAAARARFLVAGGGVAGLVTAWELARAGAGVVVLERADRLGGQVRRGELAGIPVDLGAEAFATRGGVVAALATELGLAAAVVAPAEAGAWLYPTTGRAVPVPRTSVLGIPGVPLAADVVAALGTRAALRAFADALIPGTVGSKARTLGALVRARMGAATLERLVAPVVRGVHSAHPDELELDRVVPGLRAALVREGSLARAVRGMRAAAPAGSAVQGLRGGMHTLVATLERELAALGAEVRTGVEVSDVRAGSLLAAGERLRGTVVVATPGLVGERPPVRAITLVLLAIEDARLDAAPRGTGLLVAEGAPGVAARALTHVTAKWPDPARGARHVVRLSYDRVGADWRAVAVADASALLGVPLDLARVVDATRVDWARSGRVEHPPEGVAAVGEWVAGTGLASVVAHARKVTGSLLEASGTFDVRPATVESQRSEE